jgi:membrane-bound lytic murein transglycosylase D
LHTKNGKLARAQTILVPVRGRGAVTAQNDLRAPAAVPTQHVVQRGDTLHAIAQRFAISLADIKAWNPVFEASSTISVGQTVVVGQP